MSTRIKLDSRIGWLIQNGHINNHRSMFVIVGDQAKEQIPNLFHVMNKMACRASTSVLWAYKKDLGFSSQKRKRMKMKDQKIKNKLKELDEDDPFETFVASTKIRYCYYKESHNILGQTFNMCVLQDFEAITPNILARTIETVSGGGLVVIMMKSVQSLKQLYTMTMDIHARYRTESHKDVVARFNERFMLSLGMCNGCLVLDDQLTVLPISASIHKSIPRKINETEDKELQELTMQLSSDDRTLIPAALLGLCKTFHQGKSVIQLISTLFERSLQSTAVITAARGRGKSAALGLAVSAAIAYGYSNIFLTAPSAENLKTLFEYICKGFDALKYQEHEDYELIQSTNAAFNKAIIRINVFKQHRQTIQYVQPTEHQQLAQAELLVIDEAAAIPYQHVNKLIGPYLVFMSSTLNGYEGTGRSLSLKLMTSLKESASESSEGVVLEEVVNKLKSHRVSHAPAHGRKYQHIELETPIRYGEGDPIEQWLNSLLCLKPYNYPGKLSTPHANECELYIVDRDVLFSCDGVCEVFLRALVGIFVASHYKNSPDDIQMLSDAPAHHIFVLMPPNFSVAKPQILCAVQISIEGDISKEVIMNGLRRGVRGVGDLVPWMIEQEYGERNFAGMSGARVVRIATNPEHQKMGYGSRTLQLLQDYFEGNFITSQHLTHPPPALGAVMSLKSVQTTDSMKEQTLAQHHTQLLLPLHQRSPPHLHYMAVSYGLTLPLIKFWKKFGMVPVYVAQQRNILTGEHSCIMLKRINKENEEEEEEDDGGKKVSKGDWLSELFEDFRHRLVHLLGSDLRHWGCVLAMCVISNKHVKLPFKEIDKETLTQILSRHDINRLDRYSRLLCDVTQIKDLIPRLSQLMFLQKINPQLNTSHILKQTILLGTGLQGKSFEDVASEIDQSYPVNQVLALLHQSCKSFLQRVRELMNTSNTGTTLPTSKPPLSSVQTELEEAAMEEEKKQKLKQTNNETADKIQKDSHAGLETVLREEDLAQYAFDNTNKPAPTNQNSYVSNKIKNMSGKRKFKHHSNKNNFKKHKK